MEESWLVKHGRVCVSVCKGTSVRHISVHVFEPRNGVGGLIWRSPFLRGHISIGFGIFHEVSSASLCLLRPQRASDENRGKRIL